MSLWAVRSITVSHLSNFQGLENHQESGESSQMFDPPPLLNWQQKQDDPESPQEGKKQKEDRVRVWVAQGDEMRRASLRRKGQPLSRRRGKAGQHNRQSFAALYYSLG